MIVAERKTLDEIVELINGHKRVLLLGCGECVTVCNAGGEKEVGILASQLRLYFRKEGKDKVMIEATVQRQCEHEFLEAMTEQVEESDVVISLACGVGVNFLADKAEDKLVYPGVDTTFMGGTKESGVWLEYCRGCGKCRLHLTGGICPIARCSKSLLDGPCGGTTAEGKCEVDNEIDCGWYLIFKRLKDRDELDIFKTIQPPKDWRPAGSGGPRKRVRKDMLIEEEAG